MMLQWCLNVECLNVESKQYKWVDRSVRSVEIGMDKNEIRGPVKGEGGILQ